MEIKIQEKDILTIEREDYEVIKTSKDIDRYNFKTKVAEGRHLLLNLHKIKEKSVLPTHIVKLYFDKPNEIQFFEINKRKTLDLSKLKIGETLKKTAEDIWINKKIIPLNQIQINQRNKKEIREIVDLYCEKASLAENKDLSIPFDEKEIEEIDKKIKEKAKSILEIIKKDNFLVILKTLIKENPKKFQIYFAEPFDEEFINRVVFDLFSKKVISKKDINALKSFYLNKGLFIYI